MLLEKNKYPIFNNFDNELFLGYWLNLYWVYRCPISDAELDFSNKIRHPTTPLLQKYKERLPTVVYMLTGPYIKLNIERFLINSIDDIMQICEKYELRYYTRLEHLDNSGALIPIVKCK